VNRETQILEKVVYQISSDDAPLPIEVEVSSIAISREVGRIPSAVLRVVDGAASEFDFENSAADYFEPGKMIEIKVGYGSGLTVESVFRGVVVKQNIRSYGSGETRLVVECKHPVYEMTLGRKSRVFENNDDGKIIETLLDEYLINYPLVSHDIEAPGQKHERLVQFNASDWDFLMMRADASGALCFIEDDSVNINVPAFSGATMELRFGDNLLEFESQMDSRTQPEEVVATRWIPSTGKIVEDRSSSPIAGPGNPDGASLAETTRYKKETIHFSGSRFEKDNLEPLAKARMLRMNLAKVRGTAKIVGTADISIGNTVDLAGMGKRMNGEAFVGGVRHEISNGYWHTYVQFGLSPKFHSESFNVNSPPAAGVTPAVSGLQIGVVTKLYDKHSNQGLERVAVKLPALGENVEVWARLSSIYAGGKENESRGFVFRPELGDEVLVGFIDDDPSQAAILGSMYHNNKCTAPLTAKELGDANNLHGIFSRSGMAIEFDDTDAKKPMLTLRSPDGREIILNDVDKSIVLQDKKNSITMDDDGITIESKGDIKFVTKKGTVKVEAANFNADLKKEFKYKATLATLETSAVTQITGTPINLNK
jgi:Rhs element Vgr protein